MIEVLWNLGSDLAEFFRARFDPLRDTVDILLVTAGIYWLLLLIRGTRAVQILVGLIVRKWLVTGLTLGAVTGE